MLSPIMEYFETFYGSNYGRLPPIFANPKHIFNGRNSKDYGFANDRDEGSLT
jgi:hypothetical protein